MILAAQAARAEGLRGDGPAILFGASKNRQIILGQALLLFPFACLPFSLSVDGGNFAAD